MKVRNILKVGSVVFGVSSILLVLAPRTFLTLLGLETNNGIDWSMRMIGITVFALAGNMWFNSKQSESANLKGVGIVMSVSAMALAVVTLMIPTELTWFSYIYATTGALFSIAYLLALVRGPR